MAQFGNNPKGEFPPGKKGPPRGEKSFFSIPKQDLVDILDGKDAQKLVKRAEEIALEVLKGERVTTSQIRNIYGTVKKLEMMKGGTGVMDRLIMLKPKLAYTAGRHDKVPGLKILRDILSNAIDLVSEGGQTKDIRLERFYQFFEAILAYHRAHGGK